MDENGLPITGAGVNYSAVEAINQRELITYINAFIVRTCAFLNTFSTKCESKLADLHLRLENLDTSLVLLEAKLNSVDELRDLKLENSQQTTTTTNAPEAQSNVPPAPPLPNQQTSTTTNAPPPPPPPPPPQVPEPAEPAVAVMTVSQDPRFKKYFTMLKVGVLEEAVRIKMRTEGLNPDLISTPNAPAPPPDPQHDSEESDSD